MPTETFLPCAIKSAKDYFDEKIWDERLKKFFVEPVAHTISGKKEIVSATKQLLDFIRAPHSSETPVSLLLLGDSGSGKSSLLQYLTYNLWKEYERLYSEATSAHTPWLPLYIYLPSILEKDRTTNLLGDYLGRHVGLEEDKRRRLLQQRLLLCLDGRDEISEYGNLMMSNHWQEALQSGRWKMTYRIKFTR